jgi:multiple antibiotic resistance protein
MFEYLYKAFVMLFVIVDPFYVCPVFIALTSSFTPDQRARTARKATWIAMVVLFLFAIVGDTVLDLLKISQAAFRMAGGLLLLLSAIEMVVAKSTGLRSTTPDEDNETHQRDDISVFPLAIPLIAGPGALTSIVMLMRNVEGQIITQAGVLGVMVLVLLINYVFLKFSDVIARILGVTGTNVITRALGIILSAMAIQYIVDGLNTTPLFAS